MSFGADCNLLITLMSNSVPERAVDILGYTSILMLVVGLATVNKDERCQIHKCLGMFIAVVCVIPVVLRSSSHETKLGIYMVIGLTIITIIIDYLLISRTNFIWKRVSVICLSMLVMIAGLRINPIIYGTDVIYTKPLAKKVQELLKENSESKWITLNSHVSGSYLICLGASTYNSTNYIPNEELWDVLDPKKKYEPIYNRYAHVIVQLVDEDTHVELLQDDLVILYLSYNDLKDLEVDYILTESPLENVEGVCFEEEYNEYGEYIYRVVAE